MTNHTLRLEIPQNVYELLVKLAPQMGQTPEELATHWLATAAQGHVDDPIEKFIGAFNSNVPDWTDQHDQYLGSRLKEND
jgi:hypothetical protein